MRSFAVGLVLTSNSSLKYYCNISILPLKLLFLNTSHLINKISFNALVMNLLSHLSHSKETNYFCIVECMPLKIFHVDFSCLILDFQAKTNSNSTSQIKDAKYLHFKNKLLMSRSCVCVCVNRMKLTCLVVFLYTS